MAEPQDSCIGWWKLEDRLAEIGTDAIEHGTSTWNPCKFGNGYYGNNLSNYLSIASGNGIGLTQGIIEFWFKPNYASTLFVHAGIMGDASSTYDLTFYTHNGKHTFWRGGKYVHIAGTWNTGDVMHYMGVWDSSAGFDGAKTLALYIDGVEIGSNTGALTIPSADTLNIGKIATYNKTANAVVDNLKIYNNATVYLDVIANKDTEGWGSTTNFSQAIII